MNSPLSKRLTDIVNALPLKEGMRVMEIGCGPGAAAREVSRRLQKGYVLGIDRSAKAIQKAIASSQQEIETGRLSFREVAIENFEPGTDEKKFDLIFAVRVGALDGRHPGIEQQALRRIAKALTKNGKFFIDKGNSIKEIQISR